MRSTAQQNLPEAGFVRLPQILAVIPIGKSSWWAGIRAGRFPQGIKIAPRTTAWHVEDIRELIKSIPTQQNGKDCT